MRTPDTTTSRGYIHLREGIESFLRFAKGRVWSEASRRERLHALATLDLPGFGYGINYEYGLFRQSFINGYQHEKPDHWIDGGSPWLIDRPDEAVEIPVYGSIAH